MGRFIANVFATLVALLIFFMALPILAGLLIALSMDDSGRVALPDSLVMSVELRQEFRDQPSASPFDVFGHGQPSVLGVTETIRRARNDDRVKGLYLRVGGGVGVPLAQAEEIRQALVDFKTSGKFVIAHSQAFYSTGLGGYLAASEADQIWLQPSGSVATSGVQIGSIFLKGMFDKIKATPQIAQYYEYKSAGNTFSQENFTEAHRESYMSVLQSIYDNATEEISISRGMTQESLIELLDASPYLAEEAVGAGLIDELGYDQDALQAAMAMAGDGSELVAIADYSEMLGPDYGSGETIAVIYGEGPINLGSSERSGSTFIGGDTVSHAIREAAEDEDVRAIVFRVDSPGGSADASDQIWDAVNYAKETGKPVVVSMGGVAASGGYYVSMSADHIVAQPMTITGSIGVVGGKIVIRDTLGLAGIKIGELSVGGPNTSMYSSQTEYTDGQAEARDKLMGDVYAQFTEKVAAGRGMSVEQVHDIAKGRIWTGTQAREMGLVDDLGGFDEAVDIAKSLIGVAVDDDVKLKAYPAALTPVEQFFEMLGVSSEVARVLLFFMDSEEIEAFIKVWEMMVRDEQPTDIIMHSATVE